MHEILLSPEFESIYLVPLSDLHIGDQYFNEKLFNKWVRWILGEPNIFVLFNGDIFNVATKGSVSDTYGEAMNVDEALDYGVKLLSPLKERIWDVTEGNHDARVYKEVGLRLSKQLALRLDVHYSGIETYLKVKLGKNTAYNGKQITYTLYATHGWGAGRTIGAKVNNLSKLSDIVLADLYIISHTHSVFAFPDDYFVPDTRANKLNRVTRKYASSGSFLNRGGYVVAKGYKPSTQGSSVIKFDGTKKEILVTV